MTTGNRACNLALGNDIFDSFQRYQRRLIEEQPLAHEFGFVGRRAAPDRHHPGRSTRAHPSYPAAGGVPAQKQLTAVLTRARG